MTIYEMTNAARELYEMLSNDEIDEQTLQDTLEALGTEDKLESYCKIIKQYEADTVNIKEEIQRLQNRKQTAENAIIRMKQAIQMYLDSIGASKAKAGIFSVSKRFTKAVSILDETVIPCQYWEEQKPKLSKAKIKEDINRGIEVNGAVIVENLSIMIK